MYENSVEIRIVDDGDDDDDDSDENFKKFL